MTANPLQPNVRDLQKDVIELLGQISALMNRASTTISLDQASAKYAGFKKEVDDAKYNVDKLELRMAIVAPMKAGKSTIINGIVGQDILPSRNAAMTTLPTEIVFNAELSEPALILSPKLLTVFQETLLALQQQIQKMGFKRMREKIEPYPHLIELSEQIQKKIRRRLTSSKTSGREQIIKTLTSLNDIVRLCSLVDSSSDRLTQLTDIPCIETPFWRSQDSEKSEELGNLVVVDTPGPNEAGENFRLAAAVEEQLRKSSIVLIVLDFTQLKTEAAEKVKQDVKKVIDLRGKENLYVLINKVDQRRDGDMTPKQVRQFVAAEFGIGDVENDERVFEIAARLAFVSTNFMQELDRNPNLSPKQMQTGRALAQEAFGVDWEEELERATIEQLQEKAQRVWRKSGFDQFLEKAIKALMERAAPRCMKSALKLSRSRLIQLRDDVELRSRAIAQDAEKLQREIDSLEDDLKSIEACRTRLQQVHEIKAQLNQDLQAMLQDFKKAAKVSLEDYFIEEEHQRSNWLKQKDIEARTWLLTPLTNFEFFPKWISKQMNSVLEFKPSGLFEFKNQYQAEEFVNQATTYAKQRTDSLLSVSRQKISQKVALARKNLSNSLEKETKPIIEKARTRLNKAFNSKLSLPELTLDAEELQLIKPRVNIQSRYVDQGYEYQTVKKRDWWHWLWIVPYEEKVKVKRPDKKENYYTVHLEELIKDVNQSIETAINSINQRMSKYLDEEFQERVSEHFKELEHYLGNYRNSLKQAQNDQQLSLEEKEKLVDKLSFLVPEADRYIEKADTYLERTMRLMQGTK